MVYAKDFDEKEVSWAVRQFMAIARGEVAVHEPKNPVAVVRVVTDERYCLGCCGVRVHDLVVAWHGGQLFTALTHCRACGGVME